MQQLAEIIHAANKCNNCASNSIRTNANANGRLLSLLSLCGPSGCDKAGDTFYIHSWGHSNICIYSVSLVHSPIAKTELELGNRRSTCIYEASYRLSLSAVGDLRWPKQSDTEVLPIA